MKAHTSSFANNRVPYLEGLHPRANSRLPKHNIDNIDPRIYFDYLYLHFKKLNLGKHNEYTQYEAALVKYILASLYVEYKHPPGYQYTIVNFENRPISKLLKEVSEFYKMFLPQDYQYQLLNSSIEFKFEYLIRHLAQKGLLQLYDGMVIPNRHNILLYLNTEP